MHPRHLRYLQLVIDKGSFALAAEAAGVTQPAITMAMQSLEREWGIALFEKAGRQKVPTRAALLAAQRAAEVHERLEALPRIGVSSLEWSLGREARLLRVGMAPAAALLYAPVIERAWRSHEPDGLFQIVSGSASELLSSLQGGQLELVIAPRPRRYPATGLRRCLLHESTPTVYARIGHPLAVARSLTDIAEAGWGVAGRAGTAGNVIEEAHRVRGLPAPRVLVQCADYPTLLNLVAETDLLCVVPHVKLVTHAEKSGIRRLDIKEGLPRYEVCLFWPSGSRVKSAGAIRDIIRGLETLVA